MMNTLLAISACSQQKDVSIAADGIRYRVRAGYLCWLLAQRYLLVGVLLAGCMVHSAVADDRLRASVTFTMPACTVAVDTPTVAWGNLQPEDIQMNSVSEQRKFVLTVTGCDGIGAPGLTPQINVQGKTLTNFTSTLAPDPKGSSSSLQYLFATANATAQYVGFNVCITQVSPGKCQTANPSGVYEASEANTWENLATQGSNMPATITGWIQPSNGRLTNPVLPGHMEASIEFALRYK